MRDHTNYISSVYSRNLNAEANDLFNKYDHSQLKHLLEQNVEHVESVLLLRIHDRVDILGSVLYTTLQEKMIDEQMAKQHSATSFVS